MFSRCIFCHTPFAANETVERFPRGRRVAFDPGRGRLWAVCGSCRRWSLAPIEERWEALEELERIVTDRGRLLSQTDNIALIRAGEIDVVRVGRATKLVEEAWWRYGRELRERKVRHSRLSWIEMAGAVGLSIATGGAFWLFAGSGLSDLDRWRRFGSVAWRGALVCPRCGTPTGRVRFKDSKRLIVVPGEDRDLGLEIRCPHCRAGARDGRMRLDGVAAQHVLRRTLAWHHHAGASEKRVRQATSAIETIGSAELFTRRIAERSMSLRRLRDKVNRTDAIALEIALNDDVERRLLELELDELEERWREEEELAAIVDGELTPVPALERLRRLMRGTGS